MAAEDFDKSDVVGDSVVPALNDLHGKKIG
jgi:hypothetical protein